jgi:hypothetical protein
MLRTAVAGAAMVVGLAWPAAAAGFETIMQDDARTLQGTNAETQQAFEQMARLGTDRVRITVGWAQVAPSPHARKRPARFNASDPQAYMPTPSSVATSPIVLVDRAVLMAKAAGLKVDLVLGLGAPRWAAAGAGKGDRVGAVVRPSTREFAAFARAMASRYSGNVTIPGYGLRLPRADMFEVWNEPNVPAFAQPQFAGSQAVAADWYRSLLRSAYPAIKSANPGAIVLIGSTAATGFRKGGPTTPIGPLAFIRRLACVDKGLRPIRTGGCRGFRRVPGDGFSHHPYVLKARPRTVSTNPEDVRIATLGRMTTLIDRLASRGRVSRGLTNLWLTEFGYETNQPVTNKPWSLTQQARFLAEAEYIAARDRHVRSYSQFLLRDVGTGAALRAAQRGQRQRPLGSWQTGLFFEDGSPKPSAESFRLTLLPLLGAGKDVVSLYGHVRPARAPATVRIERQVGDGSWQPIATSPSGGGAGEQQFSTGGDGTFLRRISGPGLADGVFRLVWIKPDGSADAGPGQSAGSL